MANIKSAIKRNKQNEKKRLRNRVFRGSARTFIAKADKAIVDGTPESAEAVKNAISALDKAADQRCYSQEQCCPPQKSPDETA